MCALLVTATAQAVEQRGDIVTVETIQYQNQVVLGGTVVPAREVLISAQLPGRIEYLAGSEGDSFSADTILVALDDDELLAQRRAAIAAMQSAEAAWRNAGTQLNRELVSPQSRNTMSGMGMPGMFDQVFTRNFSDMMGINNPGMERHADIYNRTTAMEQARSAYDQARSQLEQIDSKLRDAVGRAPFDGVIVDKLVEVGDTVQPGMPLLKFADTETLRIEINVPARLMPGVRQDDILQAKLDVRDTQVKAKVSQIFPMADPIRHTVTVKLDLPLNAPAAPGMYAEVRVSDVNTPVQNLPIIPVSALVERGSLPLVYVINQRGEKEMRVVRKGQQVEGERIIILSGLRPGEQVLNNPVPGIGSRSGY
ncbi:efflux RND transporter periplasmic adaptor subunit [Ectothiorhodospiraceae bacterium BW-2]|nr:efflux RND transporter periplasmic adaptor subunit [Ectothiorhodospiraceae bacterium BW-2]